jgi:hypothetical protein
MKSPLYTKYIKDVEDLNNKLDNENCKLSGEMARVRANMEQLLWSNEELSGCLSIILERYGSDPAVKKLIMETLERVAKGLVKKKS